MTMHWGRITAAFVLAAATIVAGIVSFSFPASAEPPAPGRHSIIITGKDKATVAKDEITVADIARVEGRSLRDDDAVVALEKIVLARNLMPGATLTLSAQQILARLKEENVDFSAVGYQLPRVVSISRAGRRVQSEEIRAALSQFFTMMKRDASIESLRVTDDIYLPISDTSFRIEPLSQVRGGSQQFTVKAMSGESEVARFDVTAELSEWRDVPVASRPLPRGAMISEADFLKARVNLAAIPRDATYESDEIVGLQLTQDIGPGQVFRRSLLFTPPLVEAGEQVVMRYHAGALLATARAITLESGVAGQSIRVKNTASKKVIEGVLKADKSVEVTQ